MRVRVRDVMTSDVVTIRSDTPLKDAAVTMARRRISGLPVVDDGELVGIITESDFVDRLAGPGGGILSALFRKDSLQTAGDVADAMTRDPLTVAADESVTVAARLMSDQGVKRLPVVGSGGELVGIVSRADLMSTFARPDEVIASDIVNQGVVGLLGADPDSVDVSVDNGVVTLRGTVGTVTERKMLEEFARRATGVVSVESELESSLDDTRLPPM